MPLSLVKFGRASPPPPTSTLPTGTQPTAIAGGSRGKDLANTSLSLVISALEATKDLSSACPQLQLAVGVLLTVLKAYKHRIDGCSQKYSEAAEAIETLLSRIQSLNKILKKVGSDGDCPQALQERLANLAGKLTEVVNAAKQVQSKRWILQLINSAEYTEKTESWIKMLDWHIRSFVLEGTITLELTIYQGLNAINTRFDQVVDGINEVKEGINELNTLANDVPLRKELRPVIEALLYNGSSVHVGCYENTRVEVLSSLCSWLRPEHPPLSDQPILWLYALAGSGKSTIAWTIADRWKRDNLLGASFFCARDGQRSNVNCVFRTIAYQLALRFPEFQEQLTKILKTDPDLQCIEVRQATPPFPACVAVVIDALDECTDNNAVSTILKSLALYIDQLAPLKFLITSRPEENIARGFLLQSLDENTHRLALNKIPEELTKRDITVFLRSRLAAIGKDFDLGASWPAPQRLENLVGLSELLFIFAALAARYIEDQAEMDPEGRLTSLLSTGNAVATKGGSTTSPFPILDALYIQVLDAAARKLGAILKSQLKLVLGTIVLAEQRLSPTTLDVLLGLSSGTVRRVLLVLSAILIIPDRKDDTTPIGIIHLSFPNFLVDPTRCTDQSFLVRPRIQHSHIASRCLATMKALKYNILGLEIVSEHDRVLNSEITDLPARLSRNIPAALEYACRYWTRHLCEAEVCEDLLTALEEFCTCHILHWLEALSLLGCVDSAVEDLQLVQTCLKASIFERSYELLCDAYPAVHRQTQSLRATDVPSLLYDCERAVRAYYPIISTSAMYMYLTIALFAPLDTPIRRIAAKKRATLAALAFSPDGICVACAKTNGTIELLNAHTGAELQNLNSHYGERIEGLSFSPTSKELLSGSSDGTVNLWDVATGANLNTWKAHSRYQCVTSVAWSLDGSLAASASNDKTVRVWRMSSPEKMTVLQHGDGVHNVVFAQDGDLLSGSHDKTCKVWDTRSIGWDTETAIEPIRTLEHDSVVLRVAVSPDSCLVACGLLNDEIVLWTKSDGQRVRSLQGESEVNFLAFYPSGLLAAAYMGSPITLWDVSTGARVKSAGNVGARAAAFASDSVHIAHTTDGQLHIHLWPSELKQNAIRTTSIAGKLEQLAGRPPTEDREPLGNPPTSVKAAATSPTRKLVLAVYKDELRVYETSTGRCMRTIEHSSGGYAFVAWSPTGRLFACTGKDHARCRLHARRAVRPVRIGRWDDPPGDDRAERATVVFHDSLPGG
ncbi:hypothetical protein ONZ51_g12681 [Trametes cubensis]|uniref:Nephrocystin 3-like N-terminal domain-containing protein n=1 Tax=Trametes cubensis TaxID=1111947 RepID=A0AAD7TG33_9APHY|nr:hypothetical protein ONZ51_g12681 [Trametes cubensis]